MLTCARDTQTEKDRDNILPKIMASSDNYDALFQARMPLRLVRITREGWGYGQAVP